MADLKEFPLPFVFHLVDLLFELILPIFGLLNVLRCNGGIKPGCICLGLHDHMALKVHELMQTSVLLDFHDEHISFFLRLAEFHRVLSQIVTGLLPGVLQLSLLVVKCFR